MKDLFNHSKVIFMNQYSITHEKKNTFQINEDIYTTLRIGLIKKLNSNYSLIIAKMRIPTLAHFELIEKALENHKGVIIALTKNIVPFEIRKKIIEERFKDKVQVYEFNSGAIKTILREVPFGINEIFCGSDRIEDYQKQHEIKVTELIRSNHISSTLVQFCIENDNKLSFDSFTPLETQKYWNTFKEIYKKG